MSNTPLPLLPKLEHWFHIYVKIEKKHASIAYCYSVRQTHIFHIASLIEKQGRIVQRSGLKNEENKNKNENKQNI